MTARRSSPPPPMTEADLRPAALRHLARYAASSGGLRRVLSNKIRRSSALHGQDPRPLLLAVDRLVEELCERGLIDDRAVAESQIGKLRRRGTSAQKIVSRLEAKGIPDAVVSDMAERLLPADGDHAAAVRLAKRRRLGPFRTSEREANRMKDLGVLARAGFGYAVAAAVIDAPDSETLERLELPSDG